MKGLLTRQQSIILTWVFLICAGNKNEWFYIIDTHKKGEALLFKICRLYSKQFISQSFWINVNPNIVPRPLFYTTLLVMVISNQL